MKDMILGASLILFTLSSVTAQFDSKTPASSKVDRNKELARSFYEDLWFNNRTDKSIKYMPDTYIAHDIGDQNGVVEEGIRQKEIADRFWNDGNLSGKIVELWNYRHDIDTNHTLRFTIKGLLIALLIALIPSYLAVRYKRKQKKLQSS